MLAAGDQSALLSLHLQDFFLQAAKSDPASGSGIAMGLDQFLENAGVARKTPGSLDRLSHIARHCAAAARAILNEAHEEIARRHEILPIASVREVDTATMVWLNQFPGRNARQKLAGKKGMLAVCRRWTRDTSENRLFKALLLKLLKFFEMKEKALGKREEVWSALDQKIRLWLREKGAEIGRWENLPPNNRLLSDRQYGKIWKSWINLQELDHLARQDVENIDGRLLENFFWNWAIGLKSLPNVRLAQTAVAFSLKEHKTRTIWPFLNNDLALFGAFVEYGALQDFKMGLQDGKLFFISPIFNFTAVSAGRALSIIIKQKGKVEKRTYSGLDAAEKATNELIACLGKKKEPRGETVPQRGRVCHIDIGDIEPRFILDSGETQKVPWRQLGQFIDCGKYGRPFIDCGLANGIMLSENAPYYTSEDIFGDSRRNEADCAEATRHFYQAIKSFIRCETLHFIVPDSADDFSLNEARHLIRLFYPDARTLPRSIGAIFDLLRQQSEFFQNHQEVLVFVGSMLGNHIIYTPLLGTRNRHLEERLPEGGGMEWRRMPSFITDPDFIRMLVPHAMKNQPLPPPNSLILSQANIGSFADCLFLWKDKKDLQFSYAPKNANKKRLDDLRAFRHRVSYLESLAKKLGLGDLPLFYAAADLPLTSLDGGECIGQFDSLSGARHLEALSARVPDLSLWRDYIPDLFMQAPVAGVIREIQLVRKDAVAPKFGESVIVNRNIDFKLPAGAPFYRFSLVKEIGGAKLAYDIRLQSDAFPLRQDLPCKMEVSYSYGAENPFHIVVKPASPDNAPFKQIEAQWIRRGKDARLSPAPPPLPVHGWDELRAFNKGDETRDLVAEMEKTLALACAGTRFLRTGSTSYIDDKGVERIRVHLPDTRGIAWRLDRKEKKFAIINVGNYGEVYIGEYNWKDNAGKIDEVESFSFDIVKSEFKAGTWKAINILPGKSIHNFFLPGESQYFPPMQIWAQGRYMGDAAAPDNLRRLVRQFMEDLQYLYEKGLLTNRQQAQFFSYAALLHRDAPPFVREWALDIGEGRYLNSMYINAIAGFLGDLSLAEQQNLHEARIKKCVREPEIIDNFIILARAYLRAPDIIGKLSLDQAKALLGAVNNAFDKLDEHNSAFPSQATRLCELSFALLRLRAVGDESIKSLLNSNSRQLMTLTRNIEKLMEIQNRAKFPMESKIGLNAKKPPSRAAIPDVLYAIYLYLTGDDGANDIVITSISND